MCLWDRVSSAYLSAFNAENQSGLMNTHSRFEAMNRLISTTGIKPVIDKVFSFNEFPQALQYLESQKHVGKVVVRVGK